MIYPWKLQMSLVIVEPFNRNMSAYLHFRDCLHFVRALWAISRGLILTGEDNCWRCKHRSNLYLTGEYNYPSLFWLCCQPVCVWQYLHQKKKSLLFVLAPGKSNGKRNTGETKLLLNLWLIAKVLQRGFYDHFCFSKTLWFSLFYLFNNPSLTEVFPSEVNKNICCGKYRSSVQKGKCLHIGLPSKTVNFSCPFQMVELLVHFMATIFQTARAHFSLSNNNHSDFPEIFSFAIQRHVNNFFHKHWLE